MFKVFRKQYSDSEVGYDRFERITLRVEWNRTERLDVVRRRSSGAQNTRRGNSCLLPRSVAESRGKDIYALPANYTFEVRVTAMPEKAWFRPVAR